LLKDSQSQQETKLVTKFKTCSVHRFRAIYAAKMHIHTMCSLK
jgi:hypothetical protein